eukprot:7121698-Prorocentrum_lima.AAC.1
MTSSLVGSEMCIRDSPIPSYNTSSELPQHTTLALCPAMVFLGVRLLSVSYTHLTLPTICSV